MKSKVLKAVLKVGGTVALTTIGVSTAALNTLLEAAGGDTSSTIFASIEDYSFDTIKRIWKLDEYEEDIESGNSDLIALQRRISTKKNAAMQVRKLADTAKKAQNAEKYDEFIGRYEELVSEIREMEHELEMMRLGL